MTNSTCRVRSGCGRPVVLALVAVPFLGGVICALIADLKVTSSKTDT